MKDMLDDMLKGLVAQVIEPIPFIGMVQMGVERYGNSLMFDVAVRHDDFLPIGLLSMAEWVVSLPKAPPPFKKKGGETVEKKNSSKRSGKNKGRSLQKRKV